jgi:S-adenosylmethionine:tRNA ribosyltransferase-isomerase
MDFRGAQGHSAPMDVRDFDYDLPDAAVAQRPVEPRDMARLLVHGRADGRTRHRHIMDLVDELAPGDLLVANDTRVLPARVLARRASGGRVELLFLEPCPRSDEPRAWRAMVKPARKLSPGEVLSVEAPRAGLRPGGGAAPVARALEREGDGAVWHVVLERTGEEPCEAAGSTVEDLLGEFGGMPLPPYITRGLEAADTESYQTLFASAPGAVAAPTAGLHFTPRLLAALEARGVERATATLHVGAGTFLPVTAERVEEHVMHEERYELTEVACDAITRTRARGGRVVAVGTTSVRVLESCADEQGLLRPGVGRTQLFLVPGAEFRVVDALLTNFHLPRSTLLMLVSAFAGRERVLGLYAEALREGYRFYSYGDAMLLLP